MPLPDLLALLRIDLLTELILATALGGLVGLEREISGKPAGLRTNILICVGAALITDLSTTMASSTVHADPARLSAQIVSGVGFLGAGTIIQSRGSVTGLTSAATMWVVAAIGIAIGSRNITEAVGTTLLVLMVLAPLGALERRLELHRRGRLLKLTVRRDGVEPGELLAVALESGLTLHTENLEVDGELIRVQLNMTGPPEAWKACREVLSHRPEVQSLTIS